jgi:GNAT superfamily N-acetyltransferase/aspartate/glutamate racemase
MGFAGGAAWLRIALRTVAFLHTSPIHVPTFRALVSDLAPGMGDVHLVDEDLLADVRRHGLDANAETRLMGRLQELAEHAPSVIVCTCSTLGGHAERLAGQLQTAVLRIDRSMAERAVALGGRIAVVAAVESTLGPTRELLAECAAGCGSAAVVVDAPCLEAWALFERGDHAGYCELVTRHVRDLADGVDVVVLAQATMAPAAALVQDLAIPVLSSPRLAVLRAVEIAHAADATSTRADVPSWCLRPVSQADFAWLFELHRAALGEYVAQTWGWEEEVQRRMFAEAFGRPRRQVIQVGGQDVGLLAVDERSDAVYLALLELLPAWQGRGLGTEILRWLLRRARGTQRPLALSVLKANPLLMRSEP